MTPESPQAGPGQAVVVFFEPWVGPQLRNALWHTWIDTLGVKLICDLRALAPLDQEFVDQLFALTPPPERDATRQDALW